MSLPTDLVNSLSTNITNRGVIGGVTKTSQGAKRLLTKQAIQTENGLRSTNIYDRAWDVLVLLDCATREMMEEVREDYSFIGDVGEHFSPGTASAQWMRTTFTEEYADEMARTLHVTGNTSSEVELNPADFRHLEEVWRDGWDEELKTIPAREVTDRAIHYYREMQPERTILHYMQPHAPFVRTPEVETGFITPQGVKGGMNLYEAHHEAGYTANELWDAHIENLHYVLEDIETLLSSIDAERVVLSSDHGQAFGENGVWGHPESVRVDAVRKVPWCVTSATDTGEYELEFDPADTRGDELTTKEKLRHLGYL